MYPKEGSKAGLDPSLPWLVNMRTMIPSRKVCSNGMAWLQFSSQLQGADAVSGAVRSLQRFHEWMWSARAGFVL